MKWMDDPFGKTNTLFNFWHHKKSTLKMLFLETSVRAVILSVVERAVEN